MAFVPVTIRFGDSDQPAYNRSIDLTQRQFAALQAEAEDMTEPLAAIAGDLRVNIEASFASQGATGATGPWTVLSPDYAAWKAQKGPGLPILVGLRPTSWVGHRPAKRNMNQTYATSGEMMRSLLMPLADHLTWQITPTIMRYTPTSKIAGYHETGTPKMPARPPVSLTLQFLHSIDRQFVRWLAAIVRKSGF